MQTCVRCSFRPLLTEGRTGDDQVTISVKISRRRIAIDSVIKSVKSVEAGGTAVFIGSVRDNSEGGRVTGMELEAAEELALKDLRRIASLAERKYSTTGLSVVHRIGRLRVGDTIVVIAVSAPHRRDAFAACRFVIDELKKTTPMWKKEFDGSDERWVGQRE